MKAESPPLFQKEQFGRNIGVMIVNMEGERDLSLHEPIGVEVVSSAVRDAVPGARFSVYDVQTELVTTGKVDTDALAERIRQFAADTQRPVLLGIGVPIYSWEYTKALLIKLEQDHPLSPITIVLGNAIPTYTKPDLIKREFPHIKLVVGEGEETFAGMAQALARGEEIQEQRTSFQPPNLDLYARPLRVLTQDIIDLGGSIKVEASRGCGFGACTFCSRLSRGGKDYHTIPEDIVVAEVAELLKQFNITRFEFTDEEAFDDTEATARLLSALKSSGLPRVSFVASMRVGTILKLQSTGLLDQLHDAGLDKVFLGVEGGSDSYLKQVAKSQTVEEIRRAMRIVEESRMEMEIGFIMFSWRMTLKMLRENVQFLSEGNNADYVSSLFNFLAVRAGTLDEKLLRRYVNNGKFPHYDPDRQFSVNLSYYRDVPFLDLHVGEIYQEAMTFARADARLYYGLKSLVRAASLPSSIQERAVHLYLEMKALHLAFLQQAVALKHVEGIREHRKAVVVQIRDLFGKAFTRDVSDPVRREAAVFLVEEEERDRSKGDQIGSMAVCVDEQGRILLVRPRDDEEWTFPGGNVYSEEGNSKAAIREATEELGLHEGDVELLGPLPTITKEGHLDHTTGLRPRLILHHALARINGPIHIGMADHEISDILWLTPEQIMNNKVNTRENVKQIVGTIPNPTRFTPVKQVGAEFTLEMQH